MELSKPAVCKPCPTLRKERDLKLTLDGLESKTRAVTKNKVIVRSSYFKHKSTNENDMQNQTQELVLEKESPTAVLSNSTTESNSFGNNNLKSALKKRESIPIEKMQEVMSFFF